MLCTRVCIRCPIAMSSTKMLDDILHSTHHQLREFMTTLGRAKRPRTECNPFYSRFDKFFGYVPQLVTALAAGCHAGNGDFGTMMAIRIRAIGSPTCKQFTELEQVSWQQSLGIFSSMADLCHSGGESSSQPKRLLTPITFPSLRSKTVEIPSTKARHQTPNAR